MGLMDLLSGSGPKGLRKPKSIRVGGKRLSDILEAHAKFHHGLPGGVRADLTEADLRFADFASRPTFYGCRQSSSAPTSRAQISSRPN